MDLKTVSKPELDAILVKFYVELRKKDGTFYTKSAFRAIRNGVQRQFKALLEVDIIDDPSFTRSENVFRAQCVQLEKKGLAKVEHKPPICSTDLNKLYSSSVFDMTHPKSLQRKVFFELIFYLCR